MPQRGSGYDARLMLVLALAAPSPTPGPSLQGCEQNPFQDVCTAVQAGTGGATSVVGPLVQHALEALVIFLVVLAAGRILRRLLTGAVDRTGGDPQIRGLVRNVLTVLTWLFAVVGALVAGGLDAAYVFTFGGIFSLAIGLAFQDLLRNVLAGIFILLEKPFRFGDRVTVGDQEGVVQNIALRTTALRTGDGRLAVLPNLTVFQSVVLNSSAYDQRQFSVSLAVDDPGELPVLMEAVRAALAEVPAISTVPAPSVQPQADAAGVRLLVVRYWLDYRAHDSDAATGELLSRIWSATGKRATPAAPH